MFTFTPDQRILKIQKYPEPELRLNLLEYQQQTYRHYIEETVLSDMDFMLSKMQEQFPFSDLIAEFKVQPRYQRDSKREMKHLNPAYYPVTARFRADGMWFPDKDHPPIEIFQIPDMDDDGILNFDGSRCMLLMRTASDMGVSYAMDNKRMSITTAKRNISIDFDNTKDFRIKYGKHAVPLHDLLRVFNVKEKVYKDPASLFTSAFIMKAFAAEEGQTDETIEDKYDKMNLYATYTGTEYVLGRARDYINEICSLRRAIGRKLSRPIGPFEKGHVVDEKVIEYTSKNFINEIYVKAIPDVVGSKLSHMVRISHLEEGSPYVGFLQEILPEFEGHLALPKDVYLDTSNMIVFNPGHRLTEEDVEILVHSDERFVDCEETINRVSVTLRVPFEEEIIGNCTVRYGDVYKGNIPEGRSYDEWVYYHNNPTLEPVDDTHLNTHDIAALYSLCSFIRRNPDDNFLLDKDSGMLKRVLAVDDLFSIALRTAIERFLAMYGRAIKDRLTGEKSTPLSSSNFISLSSEWRKIMRDNHYVESANLTNPMATIAQANHLIADIKTDRPPEKMRLLAMGFYGRVCPYETPNGKKLGITNTKAIGAKIENGILKTPYRAVLKDSKGNITGISSDVVYLTATEEAKWVIGDLITLKMKDGKYLNTKVLARVPAPNNQVAIANVSANALDFVNAYCEQHLSPSAALIPFACADDAVRVTYATNMLKQSILVQGSQVPRVFTSMYRQCFNHSNTYALRAEKDGVVEEIYPGSIMLQYDGEEPIEIDINESTVTVHSINFLNFHVKTGDRFKKGDVLVDSLFAREGIYSPGVNLFAAYLADGYTYEDAVAVSEHAANQLISITNTKSEHRYKVNNSDSCRTENNYQYHYIREGGLIARATIRDGRDPRITRTHELRTDKQSGILHHIDRKKDGSKLEYTAHLLSFNRLRTGDKMAGRHSNKGTVARVFKNSEMPCFANGRPIDIKLNPCGVPSRMNLGQNYEAYLGFVATLLDVYIESDAFNGATKGDIKLLMHYVWELANNPDARSVCDKYPMLPESLHEHAMKRHTEIRDWEGCFNPDGTARLWNPETGKYLANPVTFGVPYMLKLEQEVNLKIHARAGMLEEDYLRIYKQPPKGSARGGGQRMGEMELFALAAYGAKNFLDETMNASSDNVLARIERQLDELGLPSLSTDEKALPYSVEMFRYYLESLGVKLTDDKGMLPSMSREVALARTIPDVRSMLSRGRTKPKETMSIPKESYFSRILKGGGTE